MVLWWVSPFPIVNRNPPTALMVTPKQVGEVSTKKWFRFEFYVRNLAYHKWPYLKPETFPRPIILGMHVSIFTKVLVKDIFFVFSPLFFGEDEPHFDYSNIFQRGWGLVQAPTFRWDDFGKDVQPQGHPQRSRLWNWWTLISQIRGQASLLRRRVCVLVAPML